MPRVYDLFINKPHWAKHRKQQLAAVDGEILEIGVGTGLSLQFYPKHVRRITTVDPNPGMNRILKRRIGETGMQVDLRMLGSEHLPFGDGSFDCAVSTVTLCSIERVEQALKELYRVLKPGGRFFFLEHGLSPDPNVRKWQQRLNWLQKRVGDGCRLDLDVPKLFSTQPFQSVDMDNFEMENTLKTHRSMCRGVATK